ncbi:Fc.00g086330.m01.CDS01 [Cosmosporella sp. VM-42]
MTWTRALRKASICGHWLSLTNKRAGRGQLRPEHHGEAHSPGVVRSHTSQDTHGGVASRGSGAARYMSAASTAHAKKRAVDRDFIVSVLEVSATKRDAKGYLQKYTPNPKALIEAPKFIQGDQQQQQQNPSDSPANVAIMKLRAPQEIDSDTLRGIAKTLSQLQKLGLLSVVVVDCGIDEHRLVFQDQVFRLCEAIDAFGEPGARMVKDVFAQTKTTSSPAYLSGDIKVDDQGYIDRVLHHGLIPVIPSILARDETSPLQPIDSNKIVLALTRHFAGLRFEDLGDDLSKFTRPKPIASVERIIILDPLGGTPVTDRPGACHRFINIEQEYSTLLKHLTGPDGSPLALESHAKASVTAHAANLTLAKDALSMLPSSSSALITTPFAAANMLNTTGPEFEFGSMVTTRRKKNPLLHNLLTDKPVYSSSLPRTRTQSSFETTPPVEFSSASTLLKRGMPLTIFPDPGEHPWTPPKPGAPRFRLTDNCVDMPRLVNLIEDSFNRKLDVQDYLNRVNENLAGIIVAGEYEGGAILTWEQPDGMDEETAYKQGQFVPYLDKFAVLKRSQGSGGVADIVFNAMVQDCFPDGVCWRSRKDNPVNKWYFERSAGTNKLSDCNWTMFWTTPGLNCRHPKLQDYEAVCRGVQPSWADNKHILD